MRFSNLQYSSKYCLGLLALVIVVRIGFHNVARATGDVTSFPVANLSQPWKKGPLYNQNKAYCTIQAAMAPLLINGYVVVQDGLLVAEGYTCGNDKDDQYEAFSATKSFSTMIIGKMVELQQVSIHETLGDIFNNTQGGDDDDWVGVNQASEKKNVTLEELLTMTSGLVTGPAELSDQEDLQQVLNFMEYQEDQRGKFYYLGASMILSRIIQRRSGLTPKQFVHEYKIFDQMGICEDDYSWETFGDVEGTATGLSTSPRVLAKLGQLYLQKGFAAEGLPLIDSAWVEASTTNQLPDDTASVQSLFRGYGYQWYTDREERRDCAWDPVPSLEGAYAANGAFGQQIIVIPSQNIVIALMSNDFTYVYNNVFLVIILEHLYDLQNKAAAAADVDDEKCGTFSLWQFLRSSTIALVIGIVKVIYDLVLE
jgi:CubicO group peptidase (beta-lactamase class C family)